MNKGFPSVLTNTIMNYISTITFFILINGYPYETFTPTKGIRQGDTLSLYLFIMCANVLSNMIILAQINNMICGIVIVKHSPKIYHFFFVYDSLIFCKAN